MTKKEKQKKVAAAVVQPLAPATLLYRAKDDTYAPLGTILNCDRLSDDEMDVITLGELETHQLKMLLKHDRKYFPQAVIAYLNLADAVPSPAIGWFMLALCLMSLVQDVVSVILPGAISVGIAGGTVPPRYLMELLDVHNLFPVLHSDKRGRHQVCQPSVLKSVGSMSSAQDLLGGVADSLFGKIHFWLPVHNRPIVILPGLRADLQLEILCASPFALPIFLNRKSPLKDITTVKVKAADFAECDEVLLRNAHENLANIRALLVLFSDWVHGKGKHQREIAQGVDRFILVEQNGRFSRDLRADPQVLIRSVALSVFETFLDFCNVEGWLNDAEADTALKRAWAAILPTSSPTPPTEDAAAIPPDWANADTFWKFIAEYIGDGADILVGSKGTPETKALIAAPQDDALLILPRQRTCAAYRSFLERAGSGAPRSGFELALVHVAIDRWGVQLQTEGQNVSWRYRFYQKGQAPVNGKEKLPCLGFPIEQLPENIRRLLPSDSRSGNDVEVTRFSQHSEQKEDTKNA